MQYSKLMAAVVNVIDSLLAVIALRIRAPLNRPKPME